MRAVALLGFAVAVPCAALGQESSPEIDLGSTRIGGPGLTEEERRAAASLDEPEPALTEETLPAPGSPKRLDALHTLAERYVGGKQWEQACDRFDVIRQEYETEGVTQHPRGAQNAHRAYYQCARLAANADRHDKAERLLELSTSFGKPSVKHERVLEKLLRSRYRKKMAAGDFDGAIALFHQAQAMRANEDERIWLGQELADRAWQAYHAKDEIALEGLMRRTEEIAPLNTDFRRLKSKVAQAGAILRNVVALVAGVVAFIVLWSMFNRWRNRRLVARALADPFDDL